MNPSRLASAACFLTWECDDAAHKDWHFFPTIDIRRDCLPTAINQLLADIGTCDKVAASLTPDERFPQRQTAAIKHLKRDCVSHVFSQRHIPGPYIGRHYPQGLLADCNDDVTIYPEDMTPLRINAVDDKHIEVDFNHPLANYDVEVGLQVTEMLATNEKHSGQCNDIVADIASHGSGLQCHPSTLIPAFFTDDAFRRVHEYEDSSFYTQPRFVQHIDQQARSLINACYLQAIKPGMRVLDLMSSWESHLQDIDHSVDVTGLGINEEELLANPALHAYDVYDLNNSPKLPYLDQGFDIAICTVSVEYLTDPVSVFREVARVLKPGGRFIVTFSDRWFPEKVVRVWTELHPFERMGLVLEYFRKAGSFNQLATESWQGWLRPQDDMFFPQRITSDPVFAVQAMRT